MTVAGRAGPAAGDQTVAPDQTTLITNDAEAFALGPIDATTVGSLSISFVNVFESSHTVDNNRLHHQ